MFGGGQTPVKNELNFWVMPNAGFATRGSLKRLIQEFERVHPGVQIRLTIQPWSLVWTRLMDVLKGRYLGPRPDIIQLGTTWVATLACLGALEKVPNSSVFSEDDGQSAYVWDPGVSTDQKQDLYCIPWFIDVRVLYYRRDLFETLDLSPDLLSDWKGFFKVCLELKRHMSRHGKMKNIKAPLGMPGQKRAVLAHDLAPWIWGAGGDICTEDLSLATLDQPEAMAGCEFYFDLINQGFMSGAEAFSESQRSAGCGFFTGENVMQFSGSWPVDTYFNKEWPYARPDVADGFDTALFPAGPQGRYSFLGGSNLAVFSGSPKKDVAWEFLRFLSQTDNQIEHARKIGALTARLSSFDPLFEGYDHPKRIFWDSLGHARRLPRLVELGSVEQIIYKMGSKILSMIRSGTYNHRRLHEEMLSANDGINTVLSLHRYGTKSAEVQK